MPDLTDNRQLDRHHTELAARVGAPLEIAGIAVRRPHRARHLPVDPSLFTSDAAALVTRDAMIGTGKALAPTQGAGP
jgi:hypothetical protein